MTITKERLEQYINSPLDHGLTRSEQMEMARQLLAGMEQEPVAWPNHCDSTIPAALRFLAEKPRPIYGNSPYNTEHLYQLAREIEAMARRPLYAAPQLPQPVEPEITSEELDDELLEQLIDFRRDTLNYHKKEGNKVQTVMHGVVLRAMLELQERRAAMLQPGNDEIGSWGNHQNTPTDKPKSELLQRAEKLAEDTAALAQRVHCEDIRATVRAEHAEWATKTFGNTGPAGPLKHLSKEALEAAEAPHDLHEWADMQFLFWDAQRKAGVTDEQITAAMVEKLEINKARQWPEPKDGEPRFHIKDGE